MTRKLENVLVAWAVVYPTVTGLLAVLELLGWDLPLPVKTLLVTAILVPSTALWLIPFVSRKLGQPTPPRHDASQPTGTSPTRVIRCRRCKSRRSQAAR